MSFQVMFLPDFEEVLVPIFLVVEVAFPMVVVAEVAVVVSLTMLDNVAASPAEMPVVASSLVSAFASSEEFAAVSNSATTGVVAHFVTTNVVASSALTGVVSFVALFVISSAAVFGTLFVPGEVLPFEAVLLCVAQLVHAAEVAGIAAFGSSSPE